MPKLATQMGAPNSYMGWLLQCNSLHASTWTPNVTYLLGIETLPNKSNHLKSLHCKYLLANPICVLPCFLRRLVQYCPNSTAPSQFQ